MADEFTTSGGIIATPLIASTVFTVPVRDNTPFITKFDKDTFKGIVTRPTKTVIVDQFPDPGDFVPAGTPISVKLTVKDVIPTGTFKGIDPTLATKFTNIGALEVDLEKTDDPIAKDAKSALDKKVDYTALSTADKQAVDNFMVNRFGAGAVDTEEKKTKVYGDIQFLHHL